MTVSDMDRPARIVVTEVSGWGLTEGKTYAVLAWTGDCPVVLDDEGDRRELWFSRWIPEPSGTAAHSILTEAANIVQGARNITHGAKERSFGVIADLWNAYLAGRKTLGPVTARDVAGMMVLLKLARSVQGKAARDHFVDMAGYAAIAGELGGAA